MAFNAYILDENCKWKIVTIWDEKVPGDEGWDRPIPPAEIDAFFWFFETEHVKQAGFGWIVFSRANLEAWLKERVGIYRNSDYNVRNAVCDWIAQKEIKTFGDTVAYKRRKTKWEIQRMFK